MSDKTRGALNLVPSPQTVKLLPGKMILRSRPVIELPHPSDAREKLAAKMIKKEFHGATGKRSGLRVRVGSLSTLGTGQKWLEDDQLEYLRRAGSEQAYLLHVTQRGITVVGKTPLGALYGTQTLLQLIERRGEGHAIKNLEIRDFPSVENRYLAIAMSWYAGYGRVGFGSQLWDREQWFWFVDWCLAHKVNGISICMYGYYPFRFDKYPESVFKDVELRTWVAEAGTEATVLYTHPNVKSEFLPEVIKYANARGVTVLCYAGLNTFNGGYSLAHPESRYQSDNPEKFHQFRYNLCPSREDVRRYFDASVRRVLELGFNGLLLEESEGSGFCECPSCKLAYYGKDGDSRKALHKADYELFNRLYSVARKAKPDAIVGVRAWRMGSETGVEALREGKKSIPADAPVFWSNGMDDSRFKGWVEVFGPDRIMGQDAETLGFSTLYDGLIFMFPNQYSNYLKYVDPSYKPQYPQSLPNDVRQYQQAARYGCGGVTGYAFNWNGWELAPLSLAQYGWNPGAVPLDEFVERGYRHQFGEAGGLIAKAIRNLPIVLEDRICEGSRMIARDDPVSGGLAGLTSLQVPTRFGDGEGEIKALEADLRAAKTSLNLLGRVRGRSGRQEQDRITLGYFENAAKRTIFICEAAIAYRKAVDAERNSRPVPVIASFLRSSLVWTMEDYRLVRESSLDLMEEFHGRIHRAIETISSRLAKYYPDSGSDKI